MTTQLLTRLTRCTLAELHECNPIPGFNGYYASQDGVIWSFRKQHRVAGTLSNVAHAISLRPNSAGYLMAAVIKDGTTRPRTVFVHRLVLLAFVGFPPPGKNECCHGNGIKTDNRISNLRWGSRNDNIRDKVSHGTIPRGENAPRVTLTESDVGVILRLRDSGMMQKDICKLFAVSRVQICRICNRQQWAHVA